MQGIVGLEERLQVLDPRVEVGHQADEGRDELDGEEDEGVVQVHLRRTSVDGRVQRTDESFASRGKRGKKIPPGREEKEASQVEIVGSLFSKDTMKEQKRIFLLPAI